MKLQFRVQAKIHKPRKEVFEGVQNPQQLCRYFTKTANGPLHEGKTVIWTFAEFPGDVPIAVTRVVPEEYIQFEWETMEGGYQTQVEMSFESLDARATIVTIEESGWRENQNGLDSSYMNCQGWMQMASCLKAFLEYGINLRKGFF